MKNHISAATLGLVVGIDCIGASIAFGALLFPGPLASSIGAGICVILLSTIIVSFSTAMRSAQPNAIAVVQETNVAILAASIALIAEGMINLPEVVRGATALAILGTCSVVTGVLFWIFGRFRLGGMTRFLPYPVVAGFMAGTGWLLVQSAVMVLTDEHESARIIARLAEPVVLGKVVPAFAFALLLMWAVRRFSHSMTASAVLIGSGGAFYTVLSMLGISHEQARVWEWLPSINGDASITLLLPNQIVMNADWGMVALALPAIAAAAGLNIINLLLNTSGLELNFGREIDANAELRSAGLANILAGAFGGPVGFADLGMTTLAEKVGAKERTAGIATAIAAAIGLLFASELASAMPLFISTGLMIFLGFELLHGGVESRHRLPTMEWLVVTCILGAVILVGFMAGLALGLVFSVILFIYNYSRLPVVRVTADGKDIRSKVDRSLIANHFLDEHGPALYAIQLQGYLFFGTAEQVASRVRNRLNSKDLPALRFLILDFTRVSGIDAAAVSCFNKICSLALPSGITIIFSHLAKDDQRALCLAGIEFVEGSQTISAPDIDNALEWCEERLLEQAVIGDEEVDILHHLEGTLGAHPRLPDMLSAMEVQKLEPGTALIRAGEIADGFYVMSHGRLKVQVTMPDGHVVRYRTMTAGAIVGEVGIYIGGNRTADVIVEESSTVWRLPLATLKRLEHSDTELAMLFHRLLAVHLVDKLLMANRQVRIS